MKGLIFDIETNGLLRTTAKAPKLTKVHCIAYCDAEDGVVRSVNRGDISALLTHLEDAPRLIGHNIQGFDIPALKIVYPTFAPKGDTRDTLLISRLIWPEIKKSDFALLRKNAEFPKRFIGQHGLRAWGHRLGILKGDFGDEEQAWEEWSQDMEDYCRQDVSVTKQLFRLIESKHYSEQAIELEHEFHRCIFLQEEHGFPFDEAAAKELYAELAAQRAVLEKQIQPYFPAWEETEKFIPKVNNKTRGYVKGIPFMKKKEVSFNPRSHDHIGARLKVQRKWQPMEFTETGLPKVDGDVLVELGKEWPECKLLAEHFDINKIIGMLAEGKQAWLKLVDNGRIHGGVITNGAVTGRCTHKNPNLGQIPKQGELGKKCRMLFIALPGFKLLGCDASGLELRMLAHFLARYDGGVYVEIVTTGDPHTENMKAMGITSRDKAKNGIYAFLYGAGDAKFAITIGIPVKDGKRVKMQFIKNTKGLKQLKDAVAEAVQQRGCLIGLDKRVLYVRSMHSSLNTLLQSAGALVMKLATVLLHRELNARGYVAANIVRMVVHVHDEFQLMVKEGYENEVGPLAVECIKKAGEHFGLRCPLDGEWKVGANWKETH